MTTDTTCSGFEKWWRDRNAIVPNRIYFTVTPKEVWQAAKADELAFLENIQDADWSDIWHAVNDRIAELKGKSQ